MPKAGNVRGGTLSGARPTTGTSHWQGPRARQRWSAPGGSAAARPHPAAQHGGGL